MASIPNEQVNEALFNLALEGGLKDYYGAWIGAYHDISDFSYGKNQWHWSDTRDWDYHNWAKQEPRTLDGHVEHVKFRSLWYASDGDDETNSYLCQHDVVGQFSYILL